MFKGLFVFALLIVATVSVSTPAHASALTVDGVSCWNNGFSNYSNSGTVECFASFSGGTGSYTSFRWSMRPFSSSSGPSWTTPDTSMSNTCTVGTTYVIGFTVTDSAGATASRQRNFQCRQWAE